MYMNSIYMGIDMGIHQNMNMCRCKEGNGMFKSLRDAKWCKSCICGEDFTLNTSFATIFDAKLAPFNETIFFCQQKVKDPNLLQELQFKWDDHHLIGIDVKWILNIFWKTNFQEVNRVSQKDIKWWIMDMPISTFSFVSKNLRIWIFCKKYNQGRWSQSDWDWCYMNSECILKDQFCGNLLWHE